MGMASNEDNGTLVDLGLVDEVDDENRWRLNRKHFPSKVGGTPAWLNPSKLPPSTKLLCTRCNKPLIFLCQIYCPIEDKDDCFHRTLFLFICRQGECCKLNENENLIVFRCQLRRDNQFYDFEPPDEFDETPDDDSDLSALCIVCGGPGPNHCAKCKVAKYCSRDHQVYDWKNGHKVKCGNENASELWKSNQKNSLRFPEWDLIIEEEKKGTRSKEVSEKAEMEYFQKLLAEKRAGSLMNESPEELEQYATKNVKDKAFNKFKKRVSQNKEQVLRYDIGGEPLWISSEGILKNEDVPKCSNCNSERQFECQIMPQLLNFLKIDLGLHCIDWGILAIYTCKNNCDNGDAYKEEFVYKQDIKM